MTPAVTLAQLSWADVVKGKSSPSETLPDTIPTEPVLLQSSPTEEALLNVLESSAPLQPAARGSLQCLCRGQVLTMLSHYGWLKAFAVIDHPMFEEHFGRIYVQKCDIVDGQTLEEGDVVSFYLYADHVGLGAEACRVEKKAEAASLSQGVSEISGMRADAAEFVPASVCAHAAETSHPVSTVHEFRADAAEFVPGGPVAPTSSDLASTGVADMFARMSRAFDSIPSNSCVQMFGINTAFFDDDETSEEGEVDSGDADKESLHEESDQSSSDTELSWQYSLNELKHEKLIRTAPWRKASLIAGPDVSNSDGIACDSTSAGMTSESESEHHFQPMLAAPPGIALPNFRPPPGLSLPSVLEPPPGIFFPPGLVLSSH